ncbi:MAG: protease, partial [Pseudomonadota bacterium]|nr:protease [Pseudomonadota bacterium]
IDLRMIDADGNAADGDQAFAFRGTSGFTGAGGEVRYAQVNGNTIVSGDIDGDRVPDFQIRLDGVFSLTNGDFVL